MLLSYSDYPRWLRMAALMLAILFIFSLCVLPAPSYAIAGVDDLALGGLIASFFAASGATLSVSGLDSSGLADYLIEQLGGYTSSIGAAASTFIDMTKIAFNAFTGRLIIAGTEAVKLANFLNWFCEENDVEAGALNTVYQVYGNRIYDDNGNAIELTFTSPIITSSTSQGRINVSSFGTTFTSGGHPYTFQGINYRFSVPSTGKLTVVRGTSSSTYFSVDGSNKGFCFVPIQLADGSYILGIAEFYNGLTSVYYYPQYSLRNFNISISFDSGNSSIAIDASDVIGIPDLDEAEETDAVVLGLDQIADVAGTYDLQDALTGVLDWTAAGEAEAIGSAVVSESAGAAAATETVSSVAIDAPSMANDTSFKALITSRFPWCIPWDLVAAIRCFNATAAVPEIEVDLFSGVSWGGMDLSDTAFTLDFSVFSRLAALSRWASTVIFCAGLALITRKMIWR